MSQAATMPAPPTLRLPRHLAVSMDGNGRWAQRRNRPRTLGHRAGAKAVQVCVDYCLSRGIEAVRPGRPLSDIGRAIQEHAEAEGFGVVRAFVGHGIGEQFHTDIHVPHYYEPRLTTTMEPGMTFTIEPMITIGAYDHQIWDDGWTAVTIDRKRTAQFEHTILVTDDGAEVLTAWPD